ncbi:ROK family glucokinase [Aquibacillus kalidii]|uniref:ROK family glucokinase n=1 Tax=Aquibacillus kalidii TaxID=2762597 RepID=UPI0016442F7E|nr:ROK family glucokinase [Aquibacillus kalidii]
MEKKILIGVDIGGTTVKIALMDLEGLMIDKWEVPTRLEEQGRHVPDDIWNSIEEKLKVNKIDKDSLLGIGAGAPGFIEPATGIVTVAVNIGWKNFDLRGKLAELSGLPVYVDNDANIAAIGENWKGSGKQAENIIAVTLGTGVGGGIIVNGNIVNGVNGTAGEIGHIMVDPGGAPCNCGRNGCLETVASATGIVRQALEAINQNPDSLLTKKYKQNDSLTSKDVFDAVEEGDQLAQDIINRVTDVLGLAIANTATAINPSMVVIGGGVSKAGESLLKPLKLAFDKYSLPRISEACRFAFAQLGNDAGVYGGAFLVAQHHNAS